MNLLRLHQAEELRQGSLEPRAADPGMERPHPRPDPKEIETPLALPTHRVGDHLLQQGMGASAGTEDTGDGPERGGPFGTQRRQPLRHDSAVEQEHAIAEGREPLHVGGAELGSG